LETTHSRPAKGTPERSARHGPHLQEGYEIVKIVGWGQKTGKSDSAPKCWRSSIIKKKLGGEN